MKARTRPRVGIALAAAILAGLVLAPSASSLPGDDPSATFTVSPNPALIGETVNFDGSGSTGDSSGSAIATYEWDLDDDPTNGPDSDGFEVDTGTTPTISRVYSSAGTFDVRLKVTDNDSPPDDDIHTESLTVHSPPTAGFIYEPSSPAVNQQITFSSTSSDPDGPIPSSGHAWDLNGDGIFDDAVGSVITHAFATNGPKSVGLRVTDSDGATAQIIRTVEVGPGNRPPTASFRITPRSPTVGDEVALISTSSDPDGPLASHEWDLDDDGEFDDASGSTVEGPVPTEGTFRLGLKVTDTSGASDTAFETITVGSRDLPLLSPFPVVRLAGELRPSGNTFVERLSIRGPKGADVDVVCRGDGCPFKERARSIKKKPLRVKAFDEPLSPKVVIKVYVTDPEMIGKFTRFKLRNEKAPKRRDKCLRGDSRKVIPCPR